ncbi:MAG: site-specific integrase, partial [Aquisalimonadaceae bacterium]
ATGQSSCRRPARVIVVGYIGAKKARDVTSDDVADILSRILIRAKETGRTGATLANRTRSYIRAAFELGRQAHRMPALRGVVKPFDLAGNPVEGVERATRRESPRDRSLTPDELRAVWFGLCEPYEKTVMVKKERKTREQVQTFKADAVLGLVVRWMLATGQRVEEVLGARWGEIDRDEQLWILPADRRKNRHHNLSREPHLVPLAGLHLALLDEIEALRVDESAWLFPATRDPNKPVSSTSLSQAIRRWCDRKELARFQPRDLRRTWKTLGGRAGVDLEVRNRIQGHAMQDVGSRHYDRYNYLAEKRAGMARWGAWLARTVADQEQGATVVQLGAQREKA